MKKIIFTLAIFAFFSTSINAQNINWVTMNEALELQKKNPKKIMVDIYTVWCGPCKMLDKQTFQNKDVATYVNKHFYAVKLNGEGNEIVNYKEITFKNPNYNISKARTRNSSHEFADFLQLKGYPTIAFFDEKGGFITPLTGFYKPQQLEFYLKMFVADKHTELKTKEEFQTYYDTFEPKFKS